MQSKDGQRLSQGLNVNWLVKLNAKNLRMDSDVHCVLDNFMLCSLDVKLQKGEPLMSPLSHDVLDR